MDEPYTTWLVRLEEAVFATCLLGMVFNVLSPTALLALALVGFFPIVAGGAWDLYTCYKSYRRME